MALVSYLIVSIVWGTTFLGIAYAVESLTSFGLPAIRFIPAGLLALAVGRFRREPLPSRADIPHLVVVGVMLMTVCMAILGWAERYVSSGVAACLGATIPLFLGVMDRTALDRLGWIGLVTGFGGVLVLLWPGGESPDLAASLALVVSCLVWSAGTLYGRKHPSTGGHFTSVGIEMVAAGTVAAVMAVFSGGVLHAPITRSSALAVAYLAVFGSLLAFSAYIHLTQAWAPSRAGTYAYWNPVVGVALGWALRHEAIHPRMWPGLGLILLGVGLVQVPRSLLGRQGRR